MAIQPTDAAQPLSETPDHLRGRIVSGMRWTLWLSALSAPFSYITTIILARVDPKALGTFGTLQVYIGAASAILFLGGNAVALKFIPQLNARQRLAFLLSYLLVVFAGLLPWLLGAALWPLELRHLFGDDPGPAFQILLVYLSPVYILYSLALAALKAMLEIKWAQVLDRLIGIGSFLIYLALFLTARLFLSKHYDVLVWVIYFGFIALVCVVALRRFFVLNDFRTQWRSLTFYLPQGFWRFLWGLQAGSAITFLSLRLDYLLVLNTGGLTTLGKYVALMAIASGVPRVLLFLLDSFLPSLTNTLAQGDLKSSSQVTETYGRISFLAAYTLACLITFFARDFVALLGPRYDDLVYPIVIAVPFGAVYAMNSFTGTVLCGCGITGWDAIAKAIWVALFATLFWPAWRLFSLTGAILAWGLAQLVYQGISLVLVKRKVRFTYSLTRTHIAFLLCLFFSALFAVYLGQISRIASTSLWLGFSFAFLGLAGYRPLEIRRLLRVLLPGKMPEWRESANIVATIKS